MSQQPSKACCTVPPATVEDYKPKGHYITLKDGMRVYTTGPSSATTAILIVFDIFGFFPQTVQGADILAHADADSAHNYRIFMPDFFYGKPFPKANFPPDTPEKQKALGDFFAGPAHPQKTSEKVIDLVRNVLPQTEEGKGVDKWASLGMCWGGKVISLSAHKDVNTPFAAAAEVHPAMIEPKDAEGIEIPIAILGSGDEDKEAIQGFKEAHKGGKNHVEIFEDQVHGWMAARAELGDKRVKEEYERGYRTLLEFYHEHL